LKISYRVLANGDQVNVVIEGSVALQRAARSHIRIQIEFLSQGEIQGAMTFTDGCHQWTLQTDLISVDRVNGSLWNPETTIWISHWCNIDSFPLNWDSSDSENLLNGSGDFGTDSIAGNQGDFASARSEGSQLSGFVGCIDLKE
jgi:hypothetical protein